MIQEITVYLIIATTLIVSFKMLYNSYQKNKDGCTPDKCESCKTSSTCDLNSELNMSTIKNFKK